MREPAANPSSPLRGAIRRLVELGFPFHPESSNAPIWRLRQWGVRQVVANWPPAARFLAYTAMTCGWPVMAGRAAWRQAGRLSTVTGLSRRRAFLVMFRAALLRNVRPGHYLRYAGVHPRLAENLDLYVFPRDSAAIAALNRLTGADDLDVADKARFADRCARHDLPHVETIVAYRSGQPIAGDPSRLASYDTLFVKPLTGHGALGTDVWVRSNDSIPTFADRDCIVQPVLENAPSLRPSAGSALASLRIVTGLDGARRVHTIFATLTLPGPTSRRAYDGTICAVALESGRIIRAYDVRRKRLTEACANTGTPLIGMSLPHWRESAALVRRAHELAFPEFVTLGWDVALTPDGPLLLEANTGWGATHQQLMCGPIGTTVMTDIVTTYLPS